MWPSDPSRAQCPEEGSLGSRRGRWGLPGLGPSKLSPGPPGRAPGQPQVTGLWSRGLWFLPECPSQALSPAGMPTAWDGQAAFLDAAPGPVGDVYSPVILAITSASCPRGARTPSSVRAVPEGPSARPTRGGAAAAAKASGTCPLSSRWGNRESAAKAAQVRDTWARAQTRPQTRDVHPPWLPFGYPSTHPVA